MHEAGGSIVVDPVDRMRDIVQGIHLSDYTDLGLMCEFIILYNSHGTDDGIGDLFPRLDCPDIGLEFCEWTFDRIVENYEDFGGSQEALYFPDTGRVPSDDWSEELESLIEIFNDPEATHLQTHALYIRKNIISLVKADLTGSRLAPLLANPSFLISLVKVYDFERSHPEEIDSAWPSEGDGFLEFVLHSVGYWYSEDIYRTWVHSRSTGDFDTFQANLVAIAKLEEQRPGATSYLSRCFGIRHFARYKTELLVEQFDCKGVASGSYGIYIGAVDDHNGAFSSRVVADSNASLLHDQVKGTHQLMAAEAETAFEFVQRLSQFDRLNGERFTIDFALIDAHGNVGSIKFGALLSVGKFALTSKIRGGERFFSPGSCIALNSCSSGHPEGIAQALSRQLDTTVVAPTAICAINSTTFICTEKGVRLVPDYAVTRDYAEEVRSVVYKSGVPLDPEQTKKYLKLK